MSKIGKWIERDAVEIRNTIEIEKYNGNRGNTIEVREIQEKRKDESLQ